MSAVFEQVMDTCARGCFTGLLKVRTREGSGELRFLSGIQDGVRFGSMEGDAALERLQAASDPEFEVVSSLPPIDAGSSDPVPIEGRLEHLHAAQLMRYCESNSLTCALELEVEGRVLTARYRLGELLSVEPDSEHTARLAEAKTGSYRFKLPRFELPEHVAQRRAASARPAAAPVAPQPRPVTPQSPPAQARPAAASAANPFAAPPSSPKPVVAPAPKPAASPAPAPVSPAAAVRPAAAAAPELAATAAAAPAAKAAQAPASAGAPLKASPAIAVTGGPSSTREPAPSSAKATPASARDGAYREAAAPSGGGSAQRAAAAAPGGAGHSPATPRAPLQDLWKDAVQPPAQTSPVELPSPTRPESPVAASPARAPRDPRLGSSPELPGLPKDSSRSSSKAWLWIVLVVGAAAATWVALGSPMP